MSRATNLVNSIIRLKITESNLPTFRIGNIVKTKDGLKVLINDVPEGNITLLNDKNHTLVLDLFGERLEFTPDTLNFKDPVKKLNNWDIPISEIASRHIEEIKAHTDIGVENRRKAKDQYQNDPEVQKERSEQVLKALQSKQIYLKAENGLIPASFIDSNNPFEYEIKYKDRDGNFNLISLDLSKNKSIWSTSLSKKALCAKLMPDIISTVNKAGFLNNTLYF